MPLPLAVPLLGAGTQVLNNAIDMWQNRQQRGFDKSMADYAYSKDLDMWNRANEYNSPKNQMLRFEEAGLNKNLIYSQGQPGQAAASMPKYQDVKGTFGVPGLNANNFASVVNSYQDYEIKNKQKDLLTEQIKNTTAERVIKFWQAANQEGAFKWKYPIQDFLTSTNFDSILGILSPQQMGEEPISNWDLSSRKLANRGQVLKNDILLNQKGISGNLKNWWDLKLNTMQDSNINIDKDSILARYIADIFGDVIKNFAGKLKTGANYVFGR